MNLTKLIVIVAVLLLLISDCRNNSKRQIRLAVTSASKEKRWLPRLEGKDA